MQEEMTCLARNIIELDFEWYVETIGERVAYDMTYGNLPEDIALNFVSLSLADYVKLDSRKFYDYDTIDDMYWAVDWMELTKQLFDKYMGVKNEKPSDTIPSINRR